jgi:carbon-monoxide dehydrogenase large subunit
VTVASGTSPQGQGHATTFAQIAADALGVPFERIRIVQGDSDDSPAGIGALASRSTAIGGSAVLVACRNLRDGQSEVEYRAPAEAWASGCCLAAVSVNRDTGELRVDRLVYASDSGVVVNPLLVQGQLVGGMAQGLGQALMEAVVYDGQGQLLTGSLMDYALPRAADIPPIDIRKIETRSRANALGAKGVGESATIGVPPALLNAVADALSGEGIHDPALDFPLTSEKIWHALQQK